MSLPNFYKVEGNGIHDRDRQVDRYDVQNKGKKWIETESMRGDREVKGNEIHDEIESGGKWNP
jgi:hypothetical protein